MNRVSLYLISIVAAFTVELICYNAVYVFSFRRRKRFSLRAAVYCALWTGVSAAIICGLSIFFRSSYNLDLANMELLRMALNFFVFLGNLGLMFFCLDEKPELLLYAAVAGLASHTIYSSLYTLLLTATDSFPVYVAALDPIDVFSVIDFIVAHAVALAAACLLFGKPFAAQRKEFDKILNLYIHLVFLIILLFVVVFQRSTVIAASGDTWVTVLFHSFTICFCLMMLIVERFMLYWAKDIQEKAAAERVYENYKLQSEFTKKSMELVNIKCHDLKHQIGSILKEKELDSGFVEDVQKAISIYDTRIKTGNESLDVVLTEKSLLCEVEGIQLTAMIDGKALSFMSVSDSYSFFGNALDNAIEHLKREPAESRFIRVSSRRMEDMLTVRIENFCAEEIRLDKAGFPVTSKEDKDNHGFGTRSMKSIAEKYGGTVVYRTGDGLFILTAIFTVPEK